MKKINKKKIKNIGIINLGYVGDIVNASPVCYQIKKQWPEAKLHFITVPKSEEISKYIPGVDEVHVFDKDIAHKGLKMIPWILSFHFKHKLDMVILLNETFRSGLLGFLTGAKYRVGHDSEGRGIFLTHKVPWTKDEKDFKVHISEIYMNNLKSIELYTESKKFGLNHNIEDSKFIDNILDEENINGKTLIGLCPCARLSCKDWTPNEAHKFIDYINKKENHNVVIIGQQSAIDFCSKLRKLGCNNFIDLSNKTSVPQLTALIKRFRIFVSVDTAPMHMSLACNIPTLGLFVQPNFGKWWPDFKKHSKLLFAAPMLAEDVIESYEELNQELK